MQLLLLLNKILSYIPFITEGTFRSAFFIEIKTDLHFSSYIYMIILQESASEQTFSFIPRSQVYDSMYITDENTNTTSEVTITSSTQGDYVDTINATFSIKENHFYKLELKNGSEIVHKDRIFCTNQPVATYSINNGEFVSKTSNNEFIIYE